MTDDCRGWWGEAVEIVGAAVLKDFPLRIWDRGRQHQDEVLREFTLMLEGQRSGQTSHAPQALVDLAEMFTRQFGPLIDQVTLAREQALARGEDRFDSEVTLPAGIPQLLQQVRSVLESVDEYCRTGDLLTLERSPESRRLFEWTAEELTRQYEGGEPTPWPGPF